MARLRLLMHMVSRVTRDSSTSARRNGFDSRPRLRHSLIYLKAVPTAAM